MRIGEVKEPAGSNCGIKGESMVPVSAALPNTYKRQQK